MSEANNGPAFPCEIGFGSANDNMHQTGTTVAQWYGMTLRDYFAIKALPVVAAGSHCMGHDFLQSEYYGSAAYDAYRMADAMLKAREAA